MKGFEAAMSGNTEKLVGSMKYIGDVAKGNEFALPVEKIAFRDPKTYLKIFKNIVIKLIEKGSMQMMEGMGNGEPMRDIFDKKIGLTIVDAAKAHTLYFTLKFFLEKIDSLGANPAHAAIKEGWVRLALIFSIDQLFVYTSQAVETGSLNQAAVVFTKEVYAELLDEIHVDALSLLEGFGYKDNMLRSTLGHSNGKFIRGDGLKFYRNAV
jgi:hypothetical protein